MNEREQVIAELLYLKHDCLEGSATDQTLDKAIALLKARKPVEPIRKEIPLAWFNKMIHACGTQGNIGAVRALRWVMGTWKMTEEIWDDEKDSRNTVGMTVLEKTINDLHKYVNYPKPLCDIVSDAILCLEEYAKYRTDNEARVMELKELAFYDAGIFVETRNGCPEGLTEELWPALGHLYCVSQNGKCGYVSFINWNADAYDFEAKDYNVEFRCWTSRPTDEQREATPWNT